MDKNVLNKLIELEDKELSDFVNERSKDLSKHQNTAVILTDAAVNGFLSDRYAIKDSGKWAIPFFIGDNTEIILPTCSKAHRKR